MASFRQGRILRIKRIAGEAVDRGVLIDMEDGWELEFKAPRGMFHIDEEVEYLPGRVNPGKGRRLAEPEKIMIRKKRAI